MSEEISIRDSGLHLGYREWGNPPYKDNEGDEWEELLICESLRCRNLEEAKEWKWVRRYMQKDWSSGSLQVNLEWDKMDFQALLMRRKTDNFLAYILFRIPKYTHITLTCCQP